jgi:cell wall assembly regulator SMI1
MNIQSRWDELTELRQRLDPRWHSPDRTSHERVDELRHALGFELPEDVLKAIRVCAGAHLAWSEPGSGGENDESGTGVAEDEVFDYGDVSFLSVGAIVDEHEGRRQLASGMEQPEIVVGPVRAKYFDPKWVPFAADVGAGRFAIDLNPAKGGYKGQVIWFHDEASVVRVVAPSVDTFLAYGCACLRYQMGELKEIPRPPFWPHAAENEADEFLSSPPCARVTALWKLICERAKAAPPNGEIPVEFHKPAKVEDIQKIEQRLKTAFPDQLKCLYRSMNGAQGMWHQQGEYGRYPICFSPLSEMVKNDKWIKGDLKDGAIELSGLPRLFGSASFVYIAGASCLRERLGFYVVCDVESSQFVGKVFLLYEDRDAASPVLSEFCNDVAAFLEQGLQQMRTSGPSFAK